MIFVIIVIIHIVGIFIYIRSNKDETPAPARMAMPESLTPEPAAAAARETDSLPSAADSAANRAAAADARAAVDAGQLLDAQSILNQAVAAGRSDQETLDLLGNVNMKLLKSPLMMPGKEYYVIQSGDYLQKIAKKYNTTVALLKTMNGLESDTIRLGDRMLAFNSDFSIRVSKSRNELDLMLNGKLFKRYRVGTGEFGKTPAVEFTLVDKIVEPPWTRPADGRQIEYGDPENVLGSRWMAIKSDDHPELTGFGIHGTWERDSIGKQSSAGCVRMLNEDVEELFDLVPRKTSVIITE